MLFTLLQAAVESSTGAVSGCLLSQISPAASAVFNTTASCGSSYILGCSYVLETGSHVSFLSADARPSATSHVSLPYSCGTTHACTLSDHLNKAFWFVTLLYHCRSDAETIWGTWAQLCWFWFLGLKMQFSRKAVVREECRSDLSPQHNHMKLVTPALSRQHQCSFQDTMKTAWGLQSSTTSSYGFHYSIKYVVKCFVWWFGGSCYICALKGREWGCLRACYPAWQQY